MCRAESIEESARKLAGRQLLRSTSSALVKSRRVPVVGLLLVAGLALAGGGVFVLVSQHRLYHVLSDSMSATVSSGDRILADTRAGGVGLSVIAGARLAGADPIIAIDVSESKKDIVLAAGATHFLLSDKGTPKAVRALTEGRGVDVAFECVGRSAAVRTTWGSSRRGARVVTLGVGAKDDMVSFSGLEIYHFARTLSAAVYGSSDPDVDVPDRRIRPRRLTRPGIPDQPPDRSRGGAGGVRADASW